MKGVCMQATQNAVRTNRGWTLCLCLVAVIVAANVCATSHAQTLIGSSGAGWQSWSVTPISFTQNNLNDSGSPYWDVQWAAAGSYGGGNLADKNAGFCMTSTGDCVGMGSGAFAPGAIPFWGMPYDAVNDAGGARDNTVYFHNNGGPLVATLYLNATANPNEVNDIGWFETNAAGTVAGAKHKLFSGTGVTKDQIPDPAGKTVIFTPTRYFGYYYSDVSEPACPDGTSTDNPCATPGPVHGCYALTLFNLNDAKCVDATGNQGDHDFIVFSANARTASHPTYWIAGEDPTDCADTDGDCNLTIMSVTALTRNP